MTVREARETVEREDRIDRLYTSFQVKPDRRGGRRWYQVVKKTGKAYPVPAAAVVYVLSGGNSGGLRHA